MDGTPTRAKTRGKREISSVTIEKASNGGAVLRCSYDNSTSGESYQPPDTLAFGSVKEAISKAEDLLGVGDGDDE